MSEEKLIRLSQAARKLNVGHNTILDFLGKKGYEVENNPNAKLTPEHIALLSKEFASSATEKLEASGLSIGTKHIDVKALDPEIETPKKRIDEEESIMIKNLGSKDLKVKEEPKNEKVVPEKAKLEGIKVLGKIELEKKPAPTVKVVAEVKTEKKTEPEKKVTKAKVEELKVIEEPVAPIEEVKNEKEVAAPSIVVQPIIEKLPEQELIKAKADRLQGLKVLDRIELPADKEKKSPVASSDIRKDNSGKRPRKRITGPDTQGQGHQPRPSGGARDGQRPPQNTQPQRG